jgi:hypothetical protein
MNRTFTGPQEAWDLIWETVEIDSQSAAFDPALRERLAKAIYEITEDEQ